MACIVALALFVERAVVKSTRTPEKSSRRTREIYCRMNPRMGITVSSRHVEADYPYRNMQCHTKSPKHEA